MNIKNLYKTCSSFYRLASDEIDYDKSTLYANYMVAFFKLSDGHPKYKEAEDKIIHMLKSLEGQEALGLSFNIFVDGLEIGKNIQRKLSKFIPYLNDEAKKEMVGWLEPQYAKEFLNDPDVEIQQIVERTLGITQDKDYKNIWKNKEINDDEVVSPNLNRDELGLSSLINKRSPSLSDKEKANELLNKLDFEFGKQNKKLN